MINIAVVEGGSLMLVHPTTSIMSTQPSHPPSCSLVQIHQPGHMLSQPVELEPLKTIMLGHHAESDPQSFVLTQSTPQPSAVVLSQSSVPPADPFVPPQPVLSIGSEIALESRQTAVSDGMPILLMDQQARPVFNQADQGPKMVGETCSSSASIYHLPSGSAFTAHQSTLINVNI